MLDFLMICITKKCDPLEYDVLISNYMSTTWWLNEYVGLPYKRGVTQGLVKDLIKLPFRKFDIILDVDWL
jgi:hypothetical protein